MSSVFGMLIISFVTFLLSGVYSRVRYGKQSKGIPVLVGVGVFLIWFAQMLVGDWSEKPIAAIIINVSLLFGLFLLFIVRERDEKKNLSLGFELALLIVPLLIGMMTLLKSTDLLELFISLELQGVVLYTAIAYNNKTIIGNEGALKYFVTGALASILFILGTAYLYEATGEMDITLMTFTDTLAYSIGSLLIIISLLIKIGAAPFHLWLIDAYEGAPLHILLVLIIFPKIFLFYFLYVFNQIFPQNWIVLVSLIISAIVGSFGAIKQTKMQRFLAYTVVFNNAFFLGLVMVNRYFAFFSLFVALIIYLTITMLNILPLVACRWRDSNRQLRVISLRDLLSIKKSNFFLAVTLGCGFLSAAGLPPLIGFFSKWYSFIPLIDYQYPFLAYFLIIASLIPSYYYLRIAAIMFFFKETPIFLLEAVSLSVGRLLSLFMYFSCFFIVNIKLLVVFFV